MLKIQQTSWGFLNASPDAFYISWDHPFNRLTSSLIFLSMLAMAMQGPAQSLYTSTTVSTPYKYAPAIQNGFQRIIRYSALQRQNAENLK